LLVVQLPRTLQSPKENGEFSLRFALHEDILTIKQKPFFIVVELLSLPSQKDGHGSMHGELSFCQTLFLAWSCALELRKQGA
jgi:hypothetical protein